MTGLLCCPTSLPVLGLALGLLKSWLRFNFHRSINLQPIWFVGNRHRSRALQRRFGVFLLDSELLPHFRTVGFCLIILNNETGFSHLLHLHPLATSFQKAAATTSKTALQSLVLRLETRPPERPISSTSAERVLIR